MDPSLLDDLAGQTGGLLYSVNNIDDPPAISARISRELRTQYLLGYCPTHPARDGKYRRVQVKLAVPKETAGLRTYYRPGYYGVTQQRAVTSESQTSLGDNRYDKAPVKIRL